MALSPQFLDELKARFTLSDVVGRSVKLVRRGRESTGLCPFHNEKTPSFTVNDQKGFYHCFGCGEHGSVIDFVMKTQGMTFPETIEVLAGEVGMDVPKPSREEVERQKERASLTEVMEAVTTWFEAQLRGQGGKAALNYTKGRGLSDETIARFRFGYSPNNRTALKDAMTARGIGEDQLIETGMLIKPEDGGASYDRFRGRLMFPITDRQGRVIAFGGRALDKNAKAKYLNSPETVLFHKGATLYNWANARAASYDSGQVLVVEGYMDVIALAQAGIDYAVAPLGTALTEEQIGHLWQMADEPILSFDGDNAGQRAASRAVERALPMLRPGKSLRFMMMPDGDDPDSLVLREGRGAIEALIDRAEPLANVLWKNLTAGVAVDTPERRAGLEKTIFVRLAEIADDNVKTLYQREYRDRIFQLFRGNRSSSLRAKSSFGARSKWDNGLKARPTGLLAKTQLGRASGAVPMTNNIQRLIVLTLINHPEIFVRYEEEIGGLELTVPGLVSLVASLLELSVEDVPLDRETVSTHLMANGHASKVNELMSDKSLKGDWFALPDAALSDALTGFEHMMQRLNFITARAEYEQAEADYAADMTEENHARFVAAQSAFREMEEKEADKDGYRLESGRFSFN